MTIRVKLFASQAEAAGTKELALEIAENSEISAAIDRIRARFPALPWPPGTLPALNQAYASPTDRLAPNDELALIPPVSGG